MPRHVVSGFLESARPSWDSGVFATHGMGLLLLFLGIVVSQLSLLVLLDLLSFDFLVLVFLCFLILIFFFSCLLLFLFLPKSYRRRDEYM